MFARELGVAGLETARECAGESSMRLILVLASFVTEEGCLLDVELALVLAAD